MQNIDNKRFAGGGNRVTNFLVKPYATLLNFFFCFILFTSTLLNAETVIGKCVGVTDGDTATVLVDGNRQIKVRFDGIDAPESSQDFGQRAKQKLSDLIYGKEVRVEISSKDKYGRSLGKVYVGSTYTNLEMVRSGLAWHYVQYSNATDLANAEKEARAKKVGLWSHANPTPPWNWRRGIGVYDNTSNTGKASGGAKLSGKSSGGAVASGAYWVSGSGKIHNKSCRYYGSSNAGTYTDNPQGTNCKVCGGDGNSSSSTKVRAGNGSKQSKTVKENTTGGKYWITGSTGKTHRKGCRWYGTTQSGHYSDRGSGDNCKKCGGAGR